MMVTKGSILLGFKVLFLSPSLPVGILLVVIGLHSTRENPDRGFELDVDHPGNHMAWL